MPSRGAILPNPKSGPSKAPMPRAPFNPCSSCPSLQKLRPHTGDQGTTGSSPWIVRYSFDLRPETSPSDSEAPGFQANGLTSAGRSPALSARLRARKLPEGRRIGSQRSRKHRPEFSGRPGGSIHQNFWVSEFTFSCGLSVCSKGWPCRSKVLCT